MFQACTLGGWLLLIEVSAWHGQHFKLCTCVVIEGSLPGPAFSTELRLLPLQGLATRSMSP